MACIQSDNIQNYLLFFPASTVHVSYMCNIVKYWQDRMGSLEQYCMNTAIQSYWIVFYVEASCQSGEMRLQSKRGSWKLLQARAGISTIVRLQSLTNALAWYVVTFENSDTDSLPEHSVQLITSA